MTSRLISSRVARAAVAATFLAGLSAATSSRPAAQTAATKAQNLVPVSEETALLAQGWAALGAGDARTAATRARDVLGKYPQSSGALTLAVEADLAMGGGLSGLGTYESWLGTRKLESPYVLRRIAQVFLREAAQGKEPRPRLGALKALASQGDAASIAALRAASQQGQFGEQQVLAEMGDPAATAALIKRLEGDLGNRRLLSISAISKTRGRAAVPVLSKLLDDADPIVVASAADALGSIGAADLIPRLRPMVAEGKPGPVRWAAARALARMGDAGGSAFLRQQLAADYSAMLQIQAAEALAPLGPSADWLDTARRLAGNPDPQVRLVVARVMAPHDQALAKELLEGLMMDTNPAIREEAADAMAGKVAGDFATLRRLLRGADGYTRVLAAARIMELTS